MTQSIEIRCRRPGRATSATCCPRGRLPIPLRCLLFNARYSVHEGPSDVRGPSQKALRAGCLLTARFLRYLLTDSSDTAEEKANKFVGVSLITMFSRHAGRYRDRHRHIIPARGLKRIRCCFISSSMSIEHECFETRAHRTRIRKAPRTAPQPHRAPRTAPHADGLLSSQLSGYSNR